MMKISFSVIAGVSLLIAGFFTSLQGQGQEASSTDSSKFVPYVQISAGGGLTRFMGDIQDASERVNVHVLGNRPAADLNVGVVLSKSFVLNVSGIYGKISGNENTFREHRNFESTMVLAGANVEYNFGHFWKERLPVFNPFITAGAYYGNYSRISTDLFGKNGEQYFYWSNGRILDREETNDHQLNQEAQNISRDYNYETSLVDNPVQTFLAAVGFGVELHISRALSVRLMSRYFHALSDNIDGHFSSGIQNARDGFFLNQLSLALNTSVFSKKNRTKPVYNYLFDPNQLEVLEQEDRDGDGVLDFEDRCAATPSGIEVDKRGCPLDGDKDGIADFRDIDPNTQEGEIVTTKGNLVDYELIENRWTNAEGARVISWDKRYPNPRFAKEESYALAFTLKKGETIDENALLKKYPKLVKKELSDSLTVFNMGTFEKFENAQEASLRTHKQLTHSAVVVNSNAVDKVAEDIAGISLPDSIANRDSYGIAESIERLKATDIRGFPQLEYTISRFEGHLKDDVPESVLVEPYLRGIAPFTWNQAVKETYVEVNTELKKNPVAKVPLATMVGSQSAEDVVASSTSKASASENMQTVESEQESLLAEFKLSPNAKLEFMPTTERFIIADLNEDNLISYKEIEKVLADIVRGGNVMEVQEFNEMVELFTDFTENVDRIDFGGTTAAYVDGKLTIFKPQNTELKKDARQLLARKYKEADLDKDGELTPNEVQKFIALFMEGKTDFKSEKIYELIDLYFE